MLTNYPQKFSQEINVLDYNIINPNYLSPRERSYHTYFTLKNPKKPIKFTSFSKIKIFIFN